MRGLSRDSRLLNDKDVIMTCRRAAILTETGRARKELWRPYPAGIQKKTPLLAPDQQFKLPARPIPRRRKSDLSERAGNAAAESKE